MSDKKTIVVPADEFAPANMPFGVVTGAGVPDYDNQKSKGKRGGFEYSVSVVLGKKEVKALEEEVLEFWEENKPKKGGDEPDNFDNLTREKDGVVKAYFKTKVDFDGKANIVPIVDGKRNPLDPEKFGSFGGETLGRVAAQLAIYGDDEDSGVSMYLSAVKLVEFEAYNAEGGAEAFGAGDEGEALAEHGFDESEKKPKKKKKSKK